MSWNIEIVDGHVAGRDDEAWEELEELRDEAAEREYGAPPSDRMMARALRTHYHSS